MKKLLILLLLAATSAAIPAQNPHLNYRHGLKFYNLSTYEESSRQKRQLNIPGNYYFYRYETSRLLQPSVAFQWNTGKAHFHEVALEDLRFGISNNVTELRNDSAQLQVTIGGEKIKETSIAMRYEYILVLSRKKESRLVPSIGFGISPYYRSYNTRHMISSAYPVSERQTGMRTYVTPRLNYFIGERFFLDLNIPLCFTDAALVSARQEDPTISPSEREASTMNISVFPKMFTARLGFGLKL